MTPEEPTKPKILISRKTMILDWIEWLVQVGEGLLVLALVWVIFCVGWRLIWEQKKLQPALQVDWRVFLAVLIPLFFRTVRTFIEEIVEAFGIKREKKAKLQAEDREESRTRVTSVQDPSEEG